jgi:hypothetical protein
MGVCTAVFTLLIGAAGLIGRGIHTPMVVVDATGFGRPGQLIYEIIDIDRQLATQHTFTIANEHSIQTEGYPGQVWQRIEHGDTVEWIFSHANGLTGELNPRIQFTIPVEFDAAPGQFSVSQLWPEERWRAHIPGSGQILEASGGDPQARVVATLPADGLDGSVFWLDGGEKLAVIGDGLTFMNLDGSQRKHLALDTQEFVFPSYSWDEKYMFVQDYNITMSGPPVVEIPVYDADTLEVTSTYIGRSPYWCEQHIAFLAEGESDTPELHLADVGTGDVTRLPLDSITSSMNTLLSFPVWDQGIETCRAFMVMDGAQSWIILRETGEIIPVGTYASFTGIEDNALVYQVMSGANGLEIWRLRLDEPQEPELLSMLQTLGQPVTLFDGVERGLYLRGVRLMLVDVASGAQTELSSHVSGRSFYLVP